MMIESRDYFKANSGNLYQVNQLAATARALDAKRIEKQSKSIALLIHDTKLEITDEKIKISAKELGQIPLQEKE